MHHKINRGALRIGVRAALLAFQSKPSCLSGRIVLTDGASQPREYVPSVVFLGKKNNNLADLGSEIAPDRVVRVRVFSSIRVLGDIQSSPSRGGAPANVSCTPNTAVYIYIPTVQGGTHTVSPPCYNGQTIDCSTLSARAQGEQRDELNPTLTEISGNTSGIMGIAVVFTGILNA